MNTSQRTRTFAFAIPIMENHNYAISLNLCVFNLKTCRRECQRARARLIITKSFCFPRRARIIMNSLFASSFTPTAVNVVFTPPWRHSHRNFFLIIHEGEIDASFTTSNEINGNVIRSFLRDLIHFDMALICKASI